MTSNIIKLEPMLLRGKDRKKNHCVYDYLTMISSFNPQKIPASYVYIIVWFVAAETSTPNFVA
jgi:hypothetical protein